MKLYDKMISSLQLQELTVTSDYERQKNFKKGMIHEAKAIHSLSWPFFH
jgi:hypothetical protein